MLYMFRTILVHHQEQLYKLYIAFGIFCNIILSVNVCKRIILVTSICDSVSVAKILS